MFVVRTLTEKTRQSTCISRSMFRTPHVPVPCSVHSSTFVRARHINDHSITIRHTRKASPAAVRRVSIGATVVAVTIVVVRRRETSAFRVFSRSARKATVTRRAFDSNTCAGRREGQRGCQGHATGSGRDTRTWTRARTDYFKVGRTATGRTVVSRSRFVTARAADPPRRERPLLSTPPPQCPAHVRHGRSVARARLDDARSGRRRSPDVSGYDAVAKRTRRRRDRAKAREDTGVAFGRGRPTVDRTCSSHGMMTHAVSPRRLHVHTRYTRPPGARQLVGTNDESRSWLLARNRSPRSDRFRPVDYTAKSVRSRTFWLLRRKLARAARQIMSNATLPWRTM